MISHGLGDPGGGGMIVKNMLPGGVMIVKTGGGMILKILPKSGGMFLKNHSRSKQHWMSYWGAKNPSTTLRSAALSNPSVQQFLRSESGRRISGSTIT